MADNKDWIVLVAGSEADPDFNDVRINVQGTTCPMKTYITGSEINIPKKVVVNSTHGNTEATLQNSEELEDIANAPGYRVVSIQHGSHYFALPSVMAANMIPIPVISVPLIGPCFGGLDAFLAPTVPKGTSAIGGVGIEAYSAATSIAVKMLKNKYNYVYVDGVDDLVMHLLSDYGIEAREITTLTNQDDKDNIILYGVTKLTDDRSTILGFHDDEMRDGFILVSPMDAKKPGDAAKLLQYFESLNNSLFVGRKENLAHFVAKIFALNDTEIADKIREAALKKADSYKPAQLKSEIMYGVNENGKRRDDNKRKSVEGV